MATAAITAERENYLNQEYGIKSWLLTVDHKRIALLYLLSITFFFFIGGFFALLIRLELLTPAGDLVQADTYNKLFTMHGQVMVFFFLIPSIPAVLGNFLVPLMIGARDLAFPRINLLSWYLYIIAGVLMLHCMLTGGVDTGWTFYTPFSTAFSNTKVIEAGLAIFISGFSSILTGLNFVVTIHRMRAPGMTWNRLPLFIWAHYATSIIQLLGTPVIAVTLVLVVLERAFHLGIFDPTRGGDPLLRAQPRGRQEDHLERRRPGSLAARPHPDDLQARPAPRHPCLAHPAHRPDFADLLTSPPGAPRRPAAKAGIAGSTWCRP